MKIKVTMKCPDAIYDAVGAEVESEIENICDDTDPIDVDADARRDEILSDLSKWVKYNECVTVEFDTAEGTARVCEA